MLTAVEDQRINQQQPENTRCPNTFKATKRGTNILRAGHKQRTDTNVHFSTI